jgi:hypothetical protein
MQWKSNTYYIISNICCLGIQLVMRMRHIVICDLPGYYSIFPQFSHKRHDFRKMFLSANCLFWFSLQIFSEIFYVLRRIERDVIRSVSWSLCKVPAGFLRFWWNLHFLNRVSKKISNIKISWRSVQWEPSSLMLTDGRRGRQIGGQTDRHNEVNSCFSQFWERALNLSFVL